MTVLFVVWFSLKICEEELHFSCENAVLCFTWKPVVNNWTSSLFFLNVCLLWWSLGMSASPGGKDLVWKYQYDFALGVYKACGLLQWEQQEHFVAVIPTLFYSCLYNSVLFLEEKSSGFRLKPPILIHGQAPSAGEFSVSFRSKIKHNNSSIFNVLWNFQMHVVIGTWQKVCLAPQSYDLAQSCTSEMPLLTMLWLTVVLGCWAWFL